MGHDKKQPYRVHFLSDGIILFRDLELTSNTDDDDSNASNNDFVPDKGCEKIFQK